MNGKHILVTGGTSGIGLSTAQKILELGGVVTCVATNEMRFRSGLLDWANHHNFTDRLNWISADFSEPAACATAIVSKISQLDGLVNCAGIASVAPLRALSSAEVERILTINLVAPIEITRALLSAKKIKRAASLVYLSSINGTTTGSKAHTVYAASKGGISGFVMALSNEVSKQKIRANAIAPGMVQTELMSKVSSLVSTDSMDTHLTVYPLGLGSSEDIANMALFLLEEKSRWITGQTMIVDGGYSIT